MSPQLFQQIAATHSELHGIPCAKHRVNPCKLRDHRDNARVYIRKKGRFLPSCQEWIKDCEKIYGKPKPRKDRCSLSAQPV